MSGGGGPRLIVFTRYPEPGKVKTRLIPALGETGTARLHREMTVHTLDQTDALQRAGAVDVEVRFTGSTCEAMAEQFGRGRAYRDQGEGDLGRRLARATDHAFSEGFGPVVVIGTDCPSLTAGVLSEALDRLASENDLVIGPACDGGYYLIGMGRACRALFENVPWGTGAVTETTLRAAERAGLRTHLLATLPDVDRPEDLEALHRTSRGDRFSGPAPRAR